MTSHRPVDEAESGAVAGEHTPTRISKDDVFHLLQSPRRRAVLRYLLEQEDTAAFEMRALAEAVAAWEHDTTVRQLHSDERQRVYVSLFQSHLPTLSEHGAIEYDQSRGTIRPGPMLAVFEPYLADGLHADAERLTPPAEAADTTTDSGIIRSVGSLFPR